MGDILVNPSASFGGYYIFISKEYDKHNLNYYVAVNNVLDNLYFPSGSPWCGKNEVISQLRKLITDKQNKES